MRTMPEKALEFLRAIREQAWDEGFRAGYAQATNGKKKKNPYRIKEKK
jgi:hypothetical protein